MFVGEMTAYLSSDSPPNTPCCNIFNCTKEEFVKNGYYCAKLFENIVCHSCGWESGSVKLSMKHLNFIHKIERPDCDMVKSEFGDFSKYFYYKKYVTNVEDMMKETFKFWPKPYPPIFDMVQAGFYYTGAEDIVGCIACGVSLDSWTSKDKPMAEHKKANPLCKFVNAKLVE